MRRVAISQGQLVEYSGGSSCAMLALDLSRPRSTQPLYTTKLVLFLSPAKESATHFLAWRCGAPGWGPHSTTTRRGFETRGALRNKENRLAGFFPLACWRVVSFASRRGEGILLLLVWQQMDVLVY